MNPVLVPVTEFLMRSQKAAVRDARSGDLVWFPALSGCTLGPGGVFCARASSAGVEDGLHRVILPRGATAWVAEVFPLHPTGVAA